MARFNFLGRAVDTYGNVKTSVGITIRLTGTSTPATVYNERTGGIGISTEPQITSDSIGRFNFYVDELDYPFVGNQKFDIIAGGITYEDLEIMRGVKVHSSLEELKDDDHPQYAALVQNEIIDGKWLFSHPVSGQAPTEDNHLTTKNYVQLEISLESASISAWADTMFASVSAASVEQDKRDRRWANDLFISTSAASVEADRTHKIWADTMFASVSAASVEQDKRERAFTVSASASLYENLNTQIASVSAASVEADRTHKIWADTMFASVSAASVEADRTHKIWADTMFASVSAASVEADRTHKIWADTMFASVSAASVEQDKRGHAFTLSASASLYENLNTQIASVSAASVEQDKRDRRWASDLFISTSAASVEADRTHKIWADTMFASVSAASVEQDKRGHAFTLSASASLYENLNTQIASVSAASVEQDKREREATNVQIASVSAASVEQDKREREATNVQIASVSAASVEADKREREATNVQTASVSAASVEQDKRLLPLDGSRSMEGNLQMNNGLYLETDEVRARDSGGLNLKDDAGTLGVFIEDGGDVGIGTNNPGAKLQLKSSANNTDVFLVTQDDDLNLMKLRQSGDAALLDLYAVGASTIHLDADSDSYFNNSGKFGIGTASPGQKLEVAGNAKLAGNVYVGPTAPSGTATIELGANSSGNRYARLDLIGDDAYSDYGLRLARNNTGANAYSQLSHRGTGNLYITTKEAANLLLGTSNTTRLIIFANGKVSLMNGTGITEFSIDGTLAGNSDDAVPTEKAVKTYSDNVSAASYHADQILQTNIDGKDNYSSWSFAVDGVTKDAIISGDVLDFVGGDNTTITRSADDQITINGSPTGLLNIIEDTTPQLGGDLDMNGKGIDFPSVANVTDVLDEDDLTSDSATKLATQQSIKKYVDDNVGGAILEGQVFL